jgi:hypothetical protein
MGDVAGVIARSFQDDKRLGEQLIADMLWREEPGGLYWQS